MGVTALRSLSAHFPTSEPQRRTEPFRSAEEAWFWTMAALMARREGARYTANRGRFSRPCEPDDVVKCLDALYRRRRIDLVHARILRIWGERQAEPCLCRGALRLEVVARGARSVGMAAPGKGNSRLTRIFCRTGNKVLDRGLPTP